MRSTVIALAASTAFVVSASPVKRQTSYSNVVYWGQSGDTYPSQGLSSYCNDDSGYDTIVISFLSNFGNGQTPNGGFYGGDSGCAIGSDGNGQSCESFAEEIKTCRSAGKRIILSLGGATGNYGLSSTGDAQGVANTLFNSYGAPAAADPAYPRPFGDAQVDGWDLDIEMNNGMNFLPDLVNQLRSNFEKDTANQYIITGAPQCYLGSDPSNPAETNMNDALTKSKFDELYIQFYNNGCGAYQYFNGNKDQFNWAAWPDYLSSGPSADAKLFLGVPAGERGATGCNADDATADCPDGSEQYVHPADMNTLINDIKSTGNFAGVMEWDSGVSDQTTENNCTFAQNMHAIFTNGSPC